MFYVLKKYQINFIISKNIEYLHFLYHNIDKRQTIKCQ